MLLDINQCIDLIYFTFNNVQQSKFLSISNGSLLLNGEINNLSFPFFGKLIDKNTMVKDYNKLCVPLTRQWFPLRGIRQKTKSFFFQIFGIGAMVAAAQATLYDHAVSKQSIVRHDGYAPLSHYAASMYPYAGVYHGHHEYVRMKMQI